MLPPDTETEALPDGELQLEAVDEVIIARAAGSRMVSTPITEQPRESIASTEYVPGQSPMAVDVFPPIGVQLYVHNPTPPLTIAVADPSHRLLQVALIEDIVILSAGGWVMITVSLVVFEAESLTVTIQEPAERPEMLEVPCPLRGVGDQIYV